MSACCRRSSPALPRRRSEGVWRAAWRRLRADRVGIFAMAVVAVFLLMIVLTASGLVARGWQKEVALPSAPPTFVGRRARRWRAEADRRARPGRSPTSRRVDPLAPRYKEWAERAAQYKTVETPRAETLPFGADRLGRDVLAKAMKGTQTSVFVGLLGALVATLIGTVLGALGGFFGGKVGDFLEWLYNVFTSIPDILLILSFAVIFGRGIVSVAIILALVGWTGIYRQVRAEFIKHSTRDYVRSAEAIGASAGVAHVPPHPAQRQPRDPGAAVAARGRLHQVRGDPVVPRPRASASTTSPGARCSPRRRAS